MRWVRRNPEPASDQAAAGTVATITLPTTQTSASALAS